MASVQGIGLSDRNRLRIADYKRTIEFEGSKPDGAGKTLPVISDTSVSLNGGLDEELSLLDMTSLRQQNADVNGGAIPYPAPAPAPMRPMFGSSRFTVANGVIGGSVIGGGLSVAKEDSLAAASLLGDDAATVYTRYTQHSKSSQAKKTQWLTMATKVLRFYAYTTEEVPNTPVETTRVRKLVVFFYLENDTLQVSEPRTRNSGMTGGAWCKRSKVKNPATGENFEPEDLAVGREIILSGRRVTIYDADDFTRSFYPFEMLAAQPVPEGNFDKPPMTAPEERTSPRVETARRLCGDKPEGGEVLEYFGAWDDSANEFGSVRRVKLSYFTEDGTLELKEADGKPKRGRQMFKQILTRAKVPRQLGAGPGSVDGIGFANNYAEGFKAADSFIDVQDLQLGSVVNVYNRLISLDMCSKLTAQWWENRGLEVPSSKIQGLAEEVAAAREAAAKAAKKPTEDDLKRADMKAFFERQAAFGTKCLRFVARNATEVVTNSAVTVPSARTTEKATFTINFHLDDNTVSVTVTAVENTGGPSGQFLRRMKLNNPATGKPFKATDLTPGTIVSLPNAKLEVFAMDSFTKSYLSGHFKRGTNLKQVFEKLRKKIVETRVNLRDVYLMIDQDRNGRVDQKEFMLIIDRSIGMGILSPEEVLVLFKKFDQRNTGSISWADFVDTMENKDAWGATPSLSDMDDTEVDKYVSSLWASSENDKEQLQLERAMKVIQTFGEQLGLMAATKLFREFDLDHNGTIELSEFRSVLVEALFMAEKDVDLVVKKVWPADPVNYENFFKVVNQFEAYKQTGRSIAKDSDHVMTSPKVSHPKRINDLLAQPLGSNNLKRVLIVEQEPAPGTIDPSFSKNSHRYDTVPLANGIIKAGIACKVYKYSPQNHATFLSTMEEFDACIVRFQTSGLKAPVGAAETFRGSLVALESNGKVVYPSPAALKAMAFATAQTPAVKLTMVKDKVVSMEPADPKYAAVKAKFEQSDMGTLMESLHHLSEPPLLWSASFVPNPALDGDFILGHYSCDCVDVSAFKAARGAIKELRNVKDNKYYEGQSICDAIGAEISKQLIV